MELKFSHTMDASILMQSALSCSISYPLSPGPPRYTGSPDNISCPTPSAVGRLGNYRQFTFVTDKWNTVIPTNEEMSFADCRSNILQQNFNNDIQCASIYSPRLTRAKTAMNTAAWTILLAVQYNIYCTVLFTFIALLLSNLIGQWCCDYTSTYNVALLHYY